MLIDIGGRQGKKNEICKILSHFHLLNITKYLGSSSLLRTIQVGTVYDNKMAYRISRLTNDEN